MKTLNDYVEEYKNQLEKGDIQKVYRSIMDFMMSLRTYFEKNIENIMFPEAFIMGIWI